jgi:ribosome-binding factor A
MLPYKRVDRVKTLLHETISEMIYDLKEPELGMVTITEVKLTDNFEEAKVYFSMLDDKEKIKKNEEILNRNAGHIRQRLGKEIKLHRIPVIKFIYDETIERATRIFDILEKVTPKESE